MLKISAPKDFKVFGTLEIPASKSISNRALIIQALSNEKIELENLSISDDTNILAEALLKIKENKNQGILELNIGLAGTSFRFLTAFLSIQNGDFILTGHQRIKERPIKDLVEALKILGADIEYLENEGFAPLHIKGKNISKNEVRINSTISSQFITALLLVAPKLQNGLKLHLEGEMASKPYIEMTLGLMKHFGVSYSFKGNLIEIEATEYKSNQLFIEADWSSASYFYEILALAKDGELKLKNYSQNSIQGDKKITDLFNDFGVATTFENNTAILTKTKISKREFVYNFINEPDLAQTFIALCVGLNKKAQLSGIESLKVKETNRINAINLEINRLGYELVLDENDNNSETYLLQKNNDSTPKNLLFETYNDHRMAMCLAPLCLKFGTIRIKNPDVVTKSNPLFWEQLKNLGFEIK